MLRLRFPFTLPLRPIAGGALLLLAAACNGPRMLRLADKPLPPLDEDETVDVYVGTIEQTHTDVAVIETGKAGWVTDEVKKTWVADLQRKARRLGANAIMETQILTQRVSGFVPDENAPFASLRQGQTDFYFMRAKAISVKATEPTTLAEARPLKGWEVEKLAVPPALPGLRSEAAKVKTVDHVSAPKEATPLPPPPDAPAEHEILQPAPRNENELPKGGVLDVPDASSSDAPARPKNSGDGLPGTQSN